MKIISVNMKQFKANFLVNSDNVRVYETIMWNKGKFITLYPDRYTELLNEFNVFYTVT